MWRLGKIGSLCMLAAVAHAGEGSHAPPPVRTLTDSFRVGLERSARALNAARDLDIARAQVRRAYSAVLPQLSADATYTRLDEVEAFDLGDGPQAFGTLDNYAASARVDQLLFSSGKVGAAVRAARLAEDQGQLGYADTIQQLKRDIQVGFLDVLLARSSVEVREASVAQFERLAEQAEQRHASGTASEFDMLSAQVRVANERPSLISARNDLALAESGFARLLAVPAESLNLTGTVHRASLALTLDELSAYALSNRPSLLMADTRQQLAVEDLRATRADGLPSLGAFFLYSGANSYGYVSFENDWQWHWNAGLAIRWNIWDGDLTRQQTKVKRLELEKFVTNREEAERSVLLEVRQAYTTVVNAEAAIAASSDNVGLARRALSIADVRYKSGLTTYLEYTDATVALSTARLAWLQANHAHAVALAQLYYACGMEVHVD